MKTNSDLFAIAIVKGCLFFYASSENDMLIENKDYHKTEKTLDVRFHIKQALDWKPWKNYFYNYYPNKGWRWVWLKNWLPKIVFQLSTPLLFGQIHPAQHFLPTRRTQKTPFYPTIWWSFNIGLPIIYYQRPCNYIMHTKVESCFPIYGWRQISWKCV